MTEALAERAVEVTSNISHLLKGAEETPQLLDNIFLLEQYGFLLPFGFHSSDGNVLGFYVKSTCLYNRRHSRTCYSGYCLEQIYWFVIFPSIGS